MTPAKLAKRKKLWAAYARKLKRIFPDAHCVLNYATPWELLVAVQLSAQCTDAMVNRVTEKLFKKYKTFDDYLRADPKAFEQDIFRTGFYRNKTKNILAAAKIVENRFGGKVPNTMEEILHIPGVARKTANVVLGNAYGVVDGIAVDTHMKRMARVWDLSDETHPEKIERDLMLIIPKKDWLISTYRLIEYGRKYCPARSHDHKVEPLAQARGTGASSRGRNVSEEKGR